MDGELDEDNQVMPQHLGHAFKQMKHCNSRRCMKNVFHECVNAHK
jgi:hypothetical protein